MPNSPEGRRIRAARAALELADLQAQAEETRASLLRLQQDVVEAEARLGSDRASQLVEANEKLVLAALRAQSDAETATRVLNEVSRSVELDALTGLPNRVLLLDRFERALASAKRHGGRLALLFLDLDEFKQINDTLGHAVGDEVLKMVAHRLAISIRDSDTVSRHGGDEFVILLTDLTQSSDAGLVAGKVIAALDVPNRVGEHTLRIKASIGISIYPDDGANADQLMDRADAAMYRAKRRGFGGFVFHGEGSLGESGDGSPTAAPRHRTLTASELALQEQDRRHAQLREANEQLSRAALRAEELRSSADHMQRRQTEFLARLALEMLRNSPGLRTREDGSAADSAGRAAAV
jgi:diguanylate cyclase (GGDEF)-like protein